MIQTAQEQTRMPDPTRDSAGVNTPELAERQNRFVQENMRRVFLIIYRMVGNVADAQDLTQEAFIKALQRGDQLKDPEKAAHWLSRIAHNTAIDFLRRHGRVNFTEIESLAEPLRVAPERSPESLVLRGEQQQYLEDGLRLLTVKERTALLLRDVEDLPAEQVAKHLGCSMATVRSHIANARIKFRRYMERRKA
ncbi:MAG: sigma-70 family RNA polymerase sigma factor [Acidobacteria bacterium]|nr:sigma-70 family RNA polymerase sigma factor [Acidobacteriota bacterium]